MSKTNAQGIARVLRKHGHNPRSTNTRTGWVGLLCTRSLDEVRVRVWEDPSLTEPKASDVAMAAEIATLLIENGYRVRYTTGDYFLYVVGKEA